MEDKKFIRRDQKDITDNSNKRKKIIIFISAILVAVLYVFLLTVDIGKEEDIENVEQLETANQEALDEKNGKLPNPISGGSINISVSRFSTVNPLLNKEKSLDQALKLVYDSLFEYDQDYNLVNEIAQGYSFSQDNKILTVDIKSGITWHDGGALTGNDVAYTINYIKARPESPYYGLVSNIASVSSSSNKVTINLVESNILEINNLIFPIITERSIGRKTILSDDNFGIIGNGMYKIISYNQGRQFILQKNENYYGAKPYIDNVTVKIFDDKEIRKNMFIASNVDIIDSNYYELSNYSYDVFQKIAYQSRNYEFIAFNSQKPPFNNQKNRAAVASILDFDQVVKDAYRETISLAQVPINSKAELYLASKTPYEYSEVRSRRFSSFESDEKIVILTDKNDPMKHRLGYIIQNQLNVIGVASEVRAAESSEMLNIIEAGNYNILISQYQASPTMDITKMLRSSSQIFKLDFTEVYELMNALKKVSNKEFIDNLYREIQDKIIYDLPYIGIGFENNYVVMHQKLYGSLEPNSYEIYNGIENLYLPN